ncbi:MULTISPECIES: hypothetical protein [Streptomyces violaceusniger group]|uniref:Uncharacterized protein n=2 Tax=Streptomyces rhizosphaericus TaxID=114699 RepID=A0ABN1PGW8_9ACTN|nr:MULTISPECIES: hypothetical protein [Streptomyces violaceusniger group]
MGRYTAELVQWTKVSLAGGYEHNGNSNGNIAYRIIDLIGARFVQWRGGMNVTLPRLRPRSDGEFLTAALPTVARPGTLRTVLVACSAANSNVLSLKVDFRSNGRVALVAQSGATPPWVSLNSVMYVL